MWSNSGIKRFENLTVFHIQYTEHEFTENGIIKEFTLKKEVTNSMEQSTSRETNHSALDQVFPHLLWNPEVNINVPYRPIVLFIPRQINPLRSNILIIQDIFKVTFPLPSISRFSKNFSRYSLRHTCGPVAQRV